MEAAFTTAILEIETSKVTVRQLHDRSRSRAPPILVYKYVDKNCSAAMLATTRSAGVTPVVNLREHTSYLDPPSANKTAHSEP